MACRKGILSSREPLLIFCTSGGDIWIFDPREYCWDQVPQTGKSSIQQILFSPDDNLIAAGDVNSVIRVWSVPDLSKVFQCSFGGTVTSLAFTTDCKYILAIVTGGIFIWDFMGDQQFEDVGLPGLGLALTFDVKTMRLALVTDTHVTIYEMKPSLSNPFTATNSFLQPLHNHISPPASSNHTFSSEPPPYSISSEADTDDPTSTPLVMTSSNLVQHSFALSEPDITDIVKSSQKKQTGGIYFDIYRGIRKASSKRGRDLGKTWPSKS
jgi:WD40 repeat protein